MQNGFLCLDALNPRPHARQATSRTAAQRRIAEPRTASPPVACPAPYPAQAPSTRSARSTARTTSRISSRPTRPRRLALPPQLAGTPSRSQRLRPTPSPSLPAASSHPCHMTRSPSLLPPSPPPSKAQPALRPPAYLIDAATNATSSILCRCSGEAPSPRSPPALLTASERRRGRVLVCPRFPKMSRTSSEAKGASCGTI